MGEETMGSHWTRERGGMERGRRKMGKALPAVAPGAFE